MRLQTFLNWEVSMSQEIKELVSIVKESNNIVFFGGAGVSTESNIPDFRSAED